LILVAAVLGAPMSATEALKARDAEVRALLPKAGAELTPATRAKIEDVLTRTVDVEAMAKSALGKHWAEQPPAKRKKFMDAFRGRFKHLIGDQITSYRESQTQFLPDEKLPAGEVKVPTVLVVKGEPTHVDYAMRSEKNGWRIVDIVIDGVSTVENYRSSFSKVIAQEGFDALITKLSSQKS
jgi:phospholipid transport system substrate-binding protein